MGQIMLINYSGGSRDIVHDNLILFVLQIILKIQMKESKQENYKKDGLDGGEKQPYLWITMSIPQENYFLLIWT